MMKLYILFVFTVLASHCSESLLLYKACKNREMVPLEQWVQSDHYIDSLMIIKIPGTRTFLTALHVAALTGFIEGVEYLLNNGASLSALSEERLNVMSYAVRSGSLPLILMLEKKYLQTSDTNIFQATQDLVLAATTYSCLHIAIHSKQYHLIPFLIDKGLSPLLTPTDHDLKYCSPLFIALMHAHDQAAQMLVEKLTERPSVDNINKFYEHALNFWYATPEELNISQALTAAIEQYFDNKQQAFKKIIIALHHPKLVDFYKKNTVKVDGPSFYRYANDFFISIKRREDKGHLELYTEKRLLETVEFIRNSALHFREHIIKDVSKENLPQTGTLQHKPNIIYRVGFQQITGRPIQGANKLLPLHTTE